MNKLVCALLVASVVLGACSDKKQSAPAAGASSPDAGKDAGAAASGAVPGTLDAIKQRGKLRVGIFTDKKPFGYVDENGVNQGYDVYLAHGLAKALFGDPNALEFFPLEAANRVEVLLSDKVDVVLANFTVTPARAEMVDFAAPYMKVAIGVVSPDTAPIKSVADLTGKELIIVKGTTAETYFAENYPDIKLQKYDQISEATNALKDGRGAGFSQDNTMVFAWALENPGFSVGIPSLGNEDYIAPAVKKGNTALLDWLNTTIKTGLGPTFFHEDYEATLRPVYGTQVDPDNVVIEQGNVP